MFKQKKSIFITAIALCFCLFFLIYSVYSQDKTKTMKNTALIVNDVQNSIFPIYNQKVVLRNIKALIRNAERKNIPVIYIQYCDNDKFKIDTDGWKIHESIQPKGKYIKVLKNNLDGFKDTDLEKILNSEKISNLIFCGLITQYCLNETIIEAVKKGYNVTVASDAHSTFNSPDAEKVINEKNEEWQKIAELQQTRKIKF